MRRLARYVIIAILLTIPSTNAWAGFNEVVATIEESTELRRIWIPFFGIARAFVKTTHPDGVYDIKLAVFEGRIGRTPSAFVDMMRDSLGSEWQPMVVSQSRKSGEIAHIFAQESKRGMRLLIVALEDGEATVIEVELDPERVDELIEGELDLGF